MEKSNSSPAPASPYQNTEERANIITELQNIQDSTQAEEVIERYYPNWIQFSANKYSSDYPQLQRNWEIVCERLQTTPKLLLFVSEVNFEESHSILQTVCNFLTKNGYICRRMSEFILCPVCEGVIPCREVYEHLKANKLPCPSVWKNICSECEQ